jgi:outer membrane protein insertion porin family
VRLSTFTSALIFSALLASQPGTKSSSQVLHAASPQQSSERDETIEELEIRGTRRVPKETVLARIQSRVGARYDEAAVRRDLELIVGLGHFDPLHTRLLTVDGPRGGKVVIFEVKEYPLIRAIEFQGLKSVSQEDVLARFRERRVGIGPELPLSPERVKAAQEILREMLAEKKHDKAQIRVEVEDISATTVALRFIIEEDPPAERKP